jgi:hypothetical protein
VKQPATTADRSSVRHDVRLSSELQRAIEATGERSAATRAVLVLGLAAAGEEVSALVPEALAALGAVHAPGLRAAVAALLSDGRPTSVVHLSDNRESDPPREDAEADADPFGELVVRL